MILKIVVVGDRGVGKSSLLRRYAKGTFMDINPSEFPAVVPEYKYETNITNEKTSEVAVLEDTVADEDYDELRPLVYVNSQKNLFKIIVIGDNKVGKTTLVRRQVNDRFEDLTEYLPVEIKWMYETLFTDNNLSLPGVIIDCLGTDEYKIIRSLVYKNAKIFLVCYSVDDELSFFHVVKKWLPEINKHQPRVPFIIVGTKNDLPAKIATREGEELAEKLHAAGFMECSSKEGSGIKELFALALKTYTSSFSYRRRNKRPCTIL